MGMSKRDLAHLRKLHPELFPKRGQKKRKRAKKREPSGVPKGVGRFSIIRKEEEE